MPRKKTASKLKSKSATSVKKIGKKTKGVAKAIVRSGSKAGKSVAKAAGGMKRKASAIVSHPRRSLRQAADNVHKTAARAREMGEAVVTAGELLQEGADFVDSIAQRAKSRIRSTASRSNRSRE